jgi:hypothetical protein
VNGRSFTRRVFHIFHARTIAERLCKLFAVDLVIVSRKYEICDGLRDVGCVIVVGTTVDLNFLRNE